MFICSCVVCCVHSHTISTYQTHTVGMQKNVKKQQIYHHRFTGSWESSNPVCGLEKAYGMKMFPEWMLRELWHYGAPGPLVKAIWSLHTPSINITSINIHNASYKEKHNVTLIMCFFIILLSSLCWSKIHRDIRRECSSWLDCVQINTLHSKLVN